MRSFLVVFALAVLVVPLAALAQEGSDPVSLIGWLWDSIASGQWVPAFAAVTMLLTRLLDLGLRERIPKKYLPYVSIGIGMLTQTSAALVGGADIWKAVALGIVAGLVASGLWSAGGKKTPAIGKPDNGGAS